jgi:hypothetical protein
MSRALLKSWQDKSSGWDYRVRWYEGEFDIRLTFDSPDGIQHRFFAIQNKAQARGAYNTFVVHHGGLVRAAPTCTGTHWDDEDACWTKAAELERKTGLPFVAQRCPVCARWIIAPAEQPTPVRRQCRRGHDMPEGAIRCLVCHPA